MRPRDVFAALVFVALSTWTAPAFAAPRACVRASVEEPFVLPDGSRHRPGLLRICLERAYSPVSGLHTIDVGDGGAGTFLSRDAVPESAAGPRAPRFLFARDARRTLTLMGYAVTDGARTRIYWIQQPR